MKLYYIIPLLVICFGMSAIAQNKTLNDSINRLEEVIVYTKKNKASTLGLKKIKLQETQKKRNSNSLTEVLRYNTSAVLKDIGNGGVSTISFRGTSATNTQVLWNGIGINAVGTGQTDFNTVAVFATDNIEVISGGSSAENGSGAIGGVVKLNTFIDFKDNESFEIHSTYGSFSTVNKFVKFKKSTSKHSFSTIATFNTSKNNYPYLDDRFRNENGNKLTNINGNYTNYSLGLNYGYKINNNHRVLFYTSHYNGLRFFSKGLPRPDDGSEKNKDINTRSLLEYKGKILGFRQNLKLAYITQEYRFFNDKDTDKFNFGKSKNIIAKYTLQKKVSTQITAKLQLGYNSVFGETDGNIHGIVSKKITSNSQLIDVLYQPNNHLQFKASARNENNNLYKLPLIYAFGGTYDINKNWTLTGSYSKNFRVPTFNELFWPIIGNPKLKPEISKQYDLGLKFQHNYFNIAFNYFNIDLKNRIQWRPTGNTNLWRPNHTEQAINKGFEIYGDIHFEIQKWKFKTIVNYSSLTSVNQTNQKDIPFIPQKNYNINTEIGYKNTIVYYQLLFRDKVYTIEDKVDFFSIDAFTVSNIGTEIKLLDTSIKKLTLGFKVNNILNKRYYFTTLRPMPGINYNININYKF